MTFGNGQHPTMICRTVYELVLPCGGHIAPYTQLSGTTA